MLQYPSGELPAIAVRGQVIRSAFPQLPNGGSLATVWGDACLRFMPLGQRSSHQCDKAASVRGI